MNNSKIISLSLLSSILIFNSMLPLAPNNKVTKNNDAKEQQSDLKTKAGFDVNKLVAQAKQLEDKKNNIYIIMEASMDLISELEGLFRKKLHTQTNFSKEEIEDRVQNFLVAEFNNIEFKLLDMNKELANKVLNTAQEPSNSINFKE